MKLLYDGYQWRRPKKEIKMSEKILLVLLICATLIVLALIGQIGKSKK